MAVNVSYSPTLGSESEDAGPFLMFSNSCAVCACTRFALFTLSQRKYALEMFGVKFWSKTLCPVVMTTVLLR